MIDEIKARCSLSEYASMCRRHDWSCAMSDDHSVYLRGTKNKRTLAELSETSPNHKRIWELARGYHEKFTGGWTFEDGWRWVGAYLWTHGIQDITEEQAQGMVAAPGTLDRYDRDVSGLIDWKEIDKTLKAVK